MCNVSSPRDRSYSRNSTQSKKKRPLFVDMFKLEALSLFLFLFRESPLLPASAAIICNGGGGVISKKVMICGTNVRLWWKFKEPQGPQCWTGPVRVPQEIALGLCLFSIFKQTKLGIFKFYERKLETWNGNVCQTHPNPPKNSCLS